MDTRKTGKVLRRKKDGGYESFSYDGANTVADPNLSEKTAREMWARGGYEEVGDADFEALQRIAYGQPSTAVEAERDFRAGAPAFAASNTADARGGPSKWAEDDFRTGAPKVGRQDDYGDAKRDGLSNPAARPAQDWVDAPKSPMPSAGGKKGRGTPSIAVGKPAADRAGAGRLPTASAMPRGAMQAMPADTTAEVERAVDPYGDARASANRNRLGAQLARAGGMVNQALSGARLDDGAYDDLEAQSEQPVADFAARREMGRQDATDAAALEERRLRAEDYARRWASGERDFKYQQERDRAGDTFRAASAAEEARRFDAQQRAAAAERGLRRQEAMDRRSDVEEARNERARLQREQAGEQERQKSLQSLGQQTSKLPIGELQQALESIDAQAPGMAYGQAPKDNPMGLKDRLARRVPFGAGEWAMSDEGKRYSATISQLRDIVMRMRSGAAINESEMRHYLALLGDDVLSDPQKAAEGINTVRQGLGQRLRNIQAPYANNGTLDEYERQGGSTFRAPIFSGGQTRNTVEAKPTGRTVTMPDGRVYDVLDNGKARPRG